MKAFHPARGRRRRRLGEPVNNAVLPADPVEHHLLAGTEPGSELLAVIREHFLGHPELLQRLVLSRTLNSGTGLGRIASSSPTHLEPFVQHVDVTTRRR
jgi:hypothetical protein